MKMPMMGMHMGMPNVMAMLPGVDAAATTMMKNLIKKKGVASIEELREAAVEFEVKLIGCQMTMDLFEYSLEDMIEGVKIGGAATYMEQALKSDVNLFIWQNADHARAPRRRRRRVGVKEKPMADATLDARGLNCPLPILKAKKALKDLPTGETLRSLGDRPGLGRRFRSVLPHDRQRTGRVEQEGGTYNFLIKRLA